MYDPQRTNSNRKVEFTTTKFGSAILRQAYWYSKAMSKKSNVSGKQLHADQRQTSFSRTIETHSRKYVGEISNAYFKALSRWRIWIIYRYSSRHLKSHEARPAPRPGNITFKCLTNERVTSPAFLFSCFWYRHQRRAMSSVATTLTTLLLSLLACLVHALPEFVIVPFCYSAF